MPGRHRAWAAAPADGLYHAGGAEHGDQDAERDGRAGACGDSRVRAREPSARLPCVRQGWRVPAAGLHIPPRIPDEPNRWAAAPLQKADPPLGEHRSRSRALRALLSMHSLLRRDRLGARADDRPARRPVVHHEPVRPAADLDLQWQHHRSLPRRRPHVARVAVRVAALGHDADRQRLLQVRRRLQRDPLAATRSARACHFA